MRLATDKFGKKLIFLLLILGFIITFAFLAAPSNIFIIIVMDIIVGLFFYFLLKIFFKKKLAFIIALPIFLIITLLSLKLFDPLNLILTISLSITIGLLIK